MNKNNINNEKDQSFASNLNRIKKLLIEIKNVCLSLNNNKDLLNNYFNFDNSSNSKETTYKDIIINLSINIETLFLKKVFANFNEIISVFGELQEKLKSELAMINTSVKIIL